MDEKWCQEKHKVVDDKIEGLVKRTDRHSDRLDNLEKFKSGTEVEMKNLVEQIKSLVSTIKWMMTSTVVLLAGFFIWYIQTLGG